ncbi:MAG: translation initiation factor eIF-2B [Thermoplasmata archaeon]|nr:translation initiation factor eIF-2B [Thermoplasmata archaeon]
MPSKHPEIIKMVERVRTDVIGGAADTAKEIVIAIKALARDSQAANPDELVAEVEEAVVDVLKVMPTLAPPINALHRVMGCMEADVDAGASISEVKIGLMKAVDEFLDWANRSLGKVAEYGAELIKDGDIVFTYSMSSTVWKIFRIAKSQGKSFEVIVTESRPANEGLWTVDEMLKLDIPISVSVDACIGELVPQSDIVFVGADAISSHGVSLCKVGSYPTALVAKANGVPFFVAADTLKFDTTSLLGLSPRIDPIHRHEVIGDKYPQDVKVVGRIFDQTPAELVDAVITEIGLLHPTACVMVMWEMKLSERLKALLPAWTKGTL